MWINTETLDVYRSKDEVRRAFGNVSFSRDVPDSQIESLAWETGRVMRVTAVPAPEFNDRTHTRAELAPEWNGSEWVQRWRVSPRPAGEVVSETARRRARRIAGVNEKLEAALLKRTLQWARNQFPAIVTRAQEKIDRINAAEEPDSVDIEDIQ